MSAHGHEGSGAALLLAAVAAGVITGQLVVARVLRPAQRVRAMGPLALSISVPPLLFVSQPSVPAAAALLLLSGVGWSYGLAKSQLLLEALPAELRSRGLTIDNSGSMLTQAVGFALGGAAAELLSPHIVVTVGGIGGLAITAAVLITVRNSQDDLEATAIAGHPQPVTRPPTHTERDRRPAGRRG